MSRQVSMTQRPEKTSYEEWMEAEGVPIIEAQCGIEDTRALERKPWPSFQDRAAGQCRLAARSGLAGRPGFFRFCLADEEGRSGALRPA